jgi:hypothetical protein
VWCVQLRRHELWQNAKKKTPIPCEVIAFSQVQTHSPVAGFRVRVGPKATRENLTSLQHRATHGLPGVPHGARSGHRSHCSCSSNFFLRSFQPLTFPFRFRSVTSPPPAKLIRSVTYDVVRTTWGHVSARNHGCVAWDSQRFITM